MIKWWLHPEDFTEKEKETFEFFEVLGFPCLSFPCLFSKDRWFSLAYQCEQDIIEELYRNASR